MDEDYVIHTFTDRYRFANKLIRAFHERKSIEETTYGVMEMLPNEQSYNLFVLKNTSPSRLVGREAIFEENGKQYMLLVPYAQDSPKYYYSEKFQQRVIADMQKYYEAKRNNNAACNLWVFPHPPVERDKSEAMFEKYKELTSDGSVLPKCRKFVSKY